MYTPAILSLWKRLILVFGDFFTLIFSLWVALFIRTGTYGRELYIEHIGAFLPVFLVSILSFFIAGLYDKDSFIYQEKTLSRLGASFIGVVITSLTLFYAFPYTGLTPKVTLLWYLLVSFGLMLAWRLSIRILFRVRNRYKTILIGEGNEFDEIKQYCRSHTTAPFEIAYHFAVSEAEMHIENKTFPKDVTAVVFDFKDKNIEPLQEYLYAKGVRGIFLVDAGSFYEETFEKLYLPSVNYGWFFEHSLSNRLYRIMKRLFDIGVSLPLSLLAIVLLPFVALVIKIEDRGPVFIRQTRVGRFNKLLSLYKFRTMTYSDAGVWLTEGDNKNKVTKVGYWLRKSRIDELPQLLNVLLGDISLIGPRPDIESLAIKLHEEIPYYNLRYTVKPGLSGWAQIKQEKPPQSVEESRLRLQYDLYYIKHRSLALELSIALKTIKTLLLRTGM